MELIGSLRVIDAILVGEADKKVKIGTGGEMSVVYCGLGHLVQTVEDGCIFNVALHFTVITLNEGSIFHFHGCAEFVELCVDNSFFIRQ